LSAARASCERRFELITRKLVVGLPAEDSLALLAVEATRRWARDGILDNVVNPGAIPSPVQPRAVGES